MVTYQSNPYLGGMFVLLFPIIFFGNLITLLILYRNRCFRQAPGTRVSLANLALIDFLHSITCLTTGINYITGQTPKTSDIGCKIGGSMRCVLTYLSVFSLMIIMINRYSVVVKGNRSNSRNVRFMSKLYIGSSWLLSFILLIIYSVTAPAGSSVKYYVMDGDCNVVLPDTIFAIHAILVLIPLFSVIIFCYVQILRKVREQGRQIASTDILQSSVKQTERKLAKIALMVLTLFFLSHLPVVIIYVIFQFALGYNVNVFWTRLSYFVFYTNFANNIIIYCLMDKQYRNALNDLSKCSKDSNNTPL